MYSTLDAKCRIMNVLSNMFLEENSTPIPIDDNTPLSATNFDSLAFAVFFVRLDEEFGLDTFENEISVDALPKTFGDLINGYSQFDKALSGNAQSL